MPGHGLIEGHPLIIIPVRELAAIVSIVSMEDFAGPGAEDRLNNIQWVAPRALRHAEVVKELNAISPVFPVSFGSLFSSPDKLVSLIEFNYHFISEFLEMVNDREEWAIKAYLDRRFVLKQLFDQKVQMVDKQLSELSPGARYFKEKQIKAEIEKGMSSWINGRVSNIGEKLGKISAHLMARKSTKLAFDENDNELVANWAILIPRDDSEKIDDIITEISENSYFEGLKISLSGPWPPYSFVPPLASET